MWSCAKNRIHQRVLLNYTEESLDEEEYCTSKTSLLVIFISGVHCFWYFLQTVWWHFNCFLTHLPEINWIWNGSVSRRREDFTSGMGFYRYLCLNAIIDSKYQYFYLLVVSWRVHVYFLNHSKTKSFRQHLHTQTTKHSM